MEQRKTRMTKKGLKDFIELLRDSPSAKAVFNPWWETDREHDINDRAPGIRRSQLFHYILERGESARYLLLAEAMGYQGGHFTGIPMTSERMLLGKMKGRGICPGHVLTSARPQRTSRPDLKPDGFSEPTATIVWGEIIKRGDPRDFILWNAFPWHPYDFATGFLSNRSPTTAELTQGVAPLMALLNMTRVKSIAALGIAAKKLADIMGIEAHHLRHSASGGASLFREEFDQYISRLR
ncbi:MAG: uracil-DNA glycosylase [Syntrophorhabdaceae bacterium]